MTMSKPMPGSIEDFPLSEIAHSCDLVIKNGGFILQKWTCDGCKRRLTANNVNVMVENGHCQHCNTVTDLKLRGCNFALLQPSQPMTVAEIEQRLGLAEPGIH